MSHQMRYHEWVLMKLKEERKMTKSNVVENLKNGIVELVFEKVDGTLRHMQATLSEEKLPAMTVTEGAKKKAKPTDSIAVFDTNISEWRSFRWDKLKSVNGVAFVNREE